MSIVVTCRECEASYKLPDRYAGKRCRCRDCQAKIRVPEAEAEGSESGEAVAEQPKRKKDKSKQRKRAKVAAALRSSQTTRRLGTNDGDIARDRRVLQKGRPAPSRGISESIHQLSPLNTGERLDTYPAQRRKRGAEKRRDEVRDEDLEPKKTRKQRKGRAEAAEPMEGRRGKKKAEKPAKAERPAKPQKAPKPEKGAKAEKAEKSAKAEKAEKSAKAGKRTAKLGRATGKQSPRERNRAKLEKARKLAERGRKGTTRYGRGKRSSDELDSDEDLPPMRPAPTKHALIAVLALVGLLSLGIGLVVGGVFGDKTPGVDVAAKLTYVEELKQNRQWEAAQKEADALETLLKQADDQESLGKLYKSRAGIDKMVAIRALPEDDDATKLQHLLRFVDDQDASLRLGAAMELRKLTCEEEAQDALVRLAKDGDAKVSEAAKQGLVSAGGPKAIPYLLEAIVDTAKTGGKVGDVAISRALELSDAEVVPLLQKILETRTKGAPAMLVQTLRKLADLASDAKQVEAARPFLQHESEEVRQAAEAALKALG
ncbi:MAG: HEAT repeat domain-containing protein [Planctomycetota bacterium]